MANERTSSARKEYATVDENPGSDGYFTNEVDIRHLAKTEKVGRIFFSIREHVDDPSATSASTVVLQYKCDGDVVWSTYIPLDASTLAIGNRFAIADTGAGVKWRAGVLHDDYSAGAVTFGFDW